MHRHGSAFLLLLLACSTAPATGDSPDARGTTPRPGALDGGPGPVDASTSPDAGAARDAGQRDAGPSEVGGVEALGPCPVDLEDRNLLGCERYRVTCGGLSPQVVKVRTWADPLRDGPSQGSIIFGMGGTGEGWTVVRTNDPAHGEHQLVRRLTREGFVVYERAWEQGWWGLSSDEQGIAAAACRYRALVTFLAAANDGPTCVFGNSGGSSEIAYGLTRHNLADAVRLAILGGGPPMGRIDYGCSADRPDLEWSGQCATFWEETQTECGRRPLKCFFEGRIVTVFDQSYSGAPCSQASDGDLQRLEADSVLGTRALLDYPDTHVHFVVGRQDCTEAPILGIPYFNGITSSKSRDLVTETPHRTIESSQGAQAVFNAFVTHCQEP